MFLKVLCKMQQNCSLYSWPVEKDHQFKILLRDGKHKLSKLKDLILCRQDDCCDELNFNIIKY